MPISRRQTLRVAGLSSLSAAGTPLLGRSAAATAPTQDRARPHWKSTLLPTWRGNDPTSAITLQWLSEDDSSRSIELTAADGAAGASAETDAIVWPESRLFRQRAVLRDLETDTDYGITIDGTEAAVTVRTAPAEHPESLTFAEGGDIGNDVENIIKLYGHAAGWDPLFGFVGGDLAYADGRSPYAWLSFLHLWNTHMRSGDRLVPMVAAIGNHEVNRETNRAPYFSRLYDNTQREADYWAFDVGEYLSIIILDTDHQTSIPGPQTEWLESALDERTDRTHLMAGYHVPGYPAAKAVNDGQSRQVRKHWVPYSRSMASTSRSSTTATCTSGRTCCAAANRYRGTRASSTSARVPGAVAPERPTPTGSFSTWPRDC